VRLAIACLSLGCAAGCGAPRATPTGAPTSSRIVVTEKTADGLVLVFLGEDGLAVGELTAGKRVIDRNATWSPDGRFVVFASTRAGGNSLWIVEARAGAEPRRLTAGKSIDQQPSFSPRGDALVFSSNRGGSFDLWRLAMAADPPRAAGGPTRLTDAPTDEQSPAWSPDGKNIVFMAVADDGSSTVWTAPAEGGAPRRISAGPLDGTPAWSPDGASIAFHALAPDRGDADLFVMKADGSERRLLYAEPLADQTGPRFSADGRFLFATSTLMSEQSGRPLLSSVVHLDLGETPPILRVLAGDVATQQRIGPALAPEPLAVAVLHANEAYDAVWLRRALCGGIDRPAVCNSPSEEERP
jgi:Tol biopolymer transport system component